jgi:MFS family permease
MPGSAAGPSYSFRQWDRNIKLFFFSNVLCQLGSGMFAVLYNLYVQALGFSQALNGHIISMTSLATALAFIPIGLAGDRFSRKALLLAGVLGTGLTGLGRSYAVTEGSLVTYALVSGLFAAAIQVLAVPFLADYAKKEQRLKLLSYHFSATLAAQVIGSSGGGVLADVLHAYGVSEVAGLQTVLAVGSVSILISFAPLLFIREQKKEQKQASAPTAEAVEVRAALAGESRKDRDLRFIGQFTFTQLLIGIGSGLVIPYLNLYFTDRFHVSLSMVGILISLGQVMTIVSMLLGPRLVRRVGQVKAVICFQLLSLPFLLLTGFTSILLVASAGYLFRQALMNAANPIHSALVMDRVSPSRRGLANSLSQMMFMTGWAVMGFVQPAIISAYGAYWGYAITFSMTGALYVTSAACFYLMFRDRKQPAAAQGGESPPRRLHELPN